MKLIGQILRQAGALSLGGILLFIGVQPVRADTGVAGGFDLLQTIAAQTVFLGANWAGAAPPTFDFGSGPVAIGNADTIVQRLAPATAPGGSVPIELVALNLVSVNPISIGGSPLDFHYITLQSDRGGPASLGTMNLQIGPEGDPHGQFSSTFNVFFDVRAGSASGPIVYSDTVALTTPGVSPWGHLPPGPAPLLIPGVNWHLAGPGDPGHDFFPAIGGFAVPIVHEHGTFGLYHTVVPAGDVSIIPEPQSALVLAFGLLAATFPVRSRRRFVLWNQDTSA